MVWSHISPKNGRLFTPKMTCSHHQSLFTPSKFVHTIKIFFTLLRFILHHWNFFHTIKIWFALSQFYAHSKMELFTPTKFYSHHVIFVHTSKILFTPWTFCIPWHYFLFTPCQLVSHHPAPYDDDDAFYLFFQKQKSGTRWAMHLVLSDATK
jgi:hypothetical protein